VAKTALVISASSSPLKDFLIVATPGLSAMIVITIVLYWVHLV